MKKIDYLICFILFTIGILSRAPFVEVFQSHWDGADYTIAIIRYSYEQFTPTPPGYPLYIALGKFFHLFIDDPHKAILTVSILASGVTASLIYLTGKLFFDKYVGIIASLIFLSGSTFYYFGLTPHGYTLIPIVYTVTASIVFNIYIQKKQNGILLGIITGLALGVRPQEIILIAPLILLGFTKLNIRERIKFVLFFTLLTLAWLLPLISVVGGIQKFISHNLTAATLGFPYRPISHNIEIMIKGFLLSFGISVFIPCILLLNRFRKTKVIIKENKIVIFFAIWMIPSILFNLVVRTEQAGYQIGYLTAALFIIAYSIRRITRKNTGIFLVIILSVVIFNLYWFFHDRDPNFIKPFRPVSFHYSDIRKNDIKTGSKVNYIKNNFNPDDTLLVAADVLWKPYSYYLKDFQIIALVALENNQSPYNYNRYEGKDWNMKHVVQKDFAIKIPQGVNKVIVMDDNGYEWVRDKSKRQILLPGNSSITVFNVLPNTTIQYGYHEILGNL